MNTYDLRDVFIKVLPFIGDFTYPSNKNFYMGQSVDGEASYSRLTIHEVAFINENGYLKIMVFFGPKSGRIRNVLKPGIKYSIEHKREFLKYLSDPHNYGK